MELTGARWRLVGAEAVLKLRALRASGGFDAYWDFHEAREYERNHAQRYTDGTVPPVTEPPPPPSSPLLTPPSTGQVTLAMPLAETLWLADEEEPHPKVIHGAFPPMGAHLTRTCWGSISVSDLREDFRFTPSTGSASTAR